MDETDITRPDFAANPEPQEPPLAPAPTETPVAPPPPPAGYAPAPQYAPTQSYYAAPPAPLGAPGIGVAGFVCVIVGLFVPIVGIVGLILSIIGYSQAKRENRPQGLALAGMIIGIVATVLGIIILIAIVASGAGGS